MKQLLISIFLLCMVVPVLEARDFQYSQLNLRYVSGKLDDGTTGSGKEVELNYDIDHVVLSLHIQIMDYSLAGDSVGRDTHMGGIGGYVKLEEYMDFFGHVRFGAYNSDASSIKLAERDVLVLLLGVRLDFAGHNEGQIYIGRYEFSENQVVGGGPALDENMIGLRAVVSDVAYPEFGFNLGAEVFDSYQYVSFGFTYNF
ncbi:MAG: hypothetical protein OEZ68_17055 [Gammaproteobacteria bacterium]|nr:hypothetical protein [Gammaproteobacteria bacterium]MDH5802512.1 hypothetical protein [Gammaproteobacteria bacterium]